MENFTPLPALLGGVMIGLAASILLIFNGRIAGVAGILGSVLTPSAAPGVPWSTWFVGGLLAGGTIVAFVLPEAFASNVTTPVGLLVGSGLLVGFGTRLAGGCTSGHGIFGLSNLELPSLISTLSFMGAGLVTTNLVYRVIF